MSKLVLVVNSKKNIGNIFLAGTNHNLDVSSLTNQSTEFNQIWR